MCEIAILDPKEYSPARMKSVAVELYDAMRSSLGIVAVHETSDGRQFEYDLYKKVKPDKDEVKQFMEKAQQQGAERVIVHGRMATTGAVTDRHSHPLPVECDKCNVDYVIHNGVVSRFHYVKSEHKDEGHEYATEVDSEVIAHDFGSVPKDWDDVGEAAQQYRLEPAYILLSADSIFIHASRYKLSEDIQMARARREFAPAGRDNQQAIVTPSNA